MERRAMAWQVGIDEAGYGPNLGPLVMTAVACRVPDEAANADLWRLLRYGIRRHGQRDDGRPVVADSKLVYSPTRGLAQREKAVLGALPVQPSALADLLTLLSPHALADLHSEAWFDGRTPLPMECSGSALHMARNLVRGACQRAGVRTEFWCRSVVVCPPRFNDLTDAANSKGAVLGEAFIRLSQACLAETDCEPTTVTVDKHGGRNHYRDMLQEAFPGSQLEASEEAMERSAYRVDGLDRAVRFTFMPRADASSFPVALASMVSKYVREALMREFNAFWQTHVPGLEPTAGYPGDSSRFFEQIQPAMQTLGLCERQVWRYR